MLHHPARRGWLVPRHAARAAILAAPAAAATEAPMRTRFLLPFAFCLLPLTLQTQTPVVSPQSIPTPASPNSAQPQLTVSRRGVLLSWIERNGDLASLKFSE